MEGENGAAADAGCQVSLVRVLILVTLDAVKSLPDTGKWCLFYDVAAATAAAAAVDETDLNGLRK